MEQKDFLQDLMHANETGVLDSRLSGGPVILDWQLVESLKKNVDFYIRSDPREALRWAELTYQISTRIEDPNARALGLRAKGQAVHAVGRYAEAVDFYQQARSVYQSHGQAVEAGRVVRAMVDALMYLGRYEEALSHAAEARQTFELNDEFLLAAQLETNVGNIYHRLDQYHQALGCYERAGKVFASIGDLTAQAVIAFNCANIYSNLDDFRLSQILYEKAESLYSGQKMVLAATQVRYSLGYLHFLKGEYHQAMHVLTNVRNEVVQLDDTQTEALCELDLAEIYLQLNAQSEAAELARTAREKFQRLEMSYEAAKALMFQGIALLQQSRLSEAEESLHLAQQEFDREGNQVHLGLIRLYLADLALRRNDGEAALEHSEQARLHFSQQKLKSKTCYAQFISARALKRIGQTDRARALTESILKDCEDLEVPWLKYQIHDLLGDLRIETGDLTGGHDAYAQSVQFIERIRALIRVDEFRGAFFKDKLRVYEKLIRLCLEQGDAEGKEQAFFYFESCKARTLVDLLINELEFFPTDQDTGQTELYQEWCRLREELHWYANKISQSERGTGSRIFEIEEKLQDEIRKRERALASLVRRAQIEAPNFFWLQNPTGLSIQELYDTLAEDEALIEYYLDGNGLKIFLVQNRELQILESPCSRKELKGLVSELKFHIEKFQYGSAYISAYQQSLFHNMQECLRLLNHALFEPVAGLVAGKKLIFIPFDLLHQVPFQALYDGESYVLDRHEVTYAPSARLHVLTSRRSPERNGPPRPLFFGVPDDAAPQIADEVQTLSRLFPEARTFIGEAASPSALLKSLPDSDLVHIASHAVFRQDNPMFSSIRLTGAWINFYDICSMRVPGSLVVLSGCHTGAGKISAGDELFGLMRGFLYAGASSLVLSRWAVDDPATSELMKLFYQRLRQGAELRVALREAALDLKKQYEHPYYWASFVLIGRNFQYYRADQI